MIVITDPGRVVDPGGGVVEPGELDAGIWRLESGTA